MAAADLLAEFHLRTTALAFDVLRLRRQGRQLPAIAFDLLIATAEALCGADLSWSFVSFRSHAEAFLSTWPEGAGLRPAWDGYFTANAGRLTARAEAVAADHAPCAPVDGLVDRPSVSVFALEAVAAGADWSKLLDGGVVHA
ncbi:hypothetical protein [Dactylosporangium sp. NPDC050588]|uniref:hypothetical protein n=1 Tax=Dactylosporangium sp. NPDC050588 TaxID=3157211 RepID=UPI0033F13D33